MFVGVPSPFTPSPPSRSTCHVFKTPPEMSTTTTEVQPAHPPAKVPAQTKHSALPIYPEYRNGNRLRQQNLTEALLYPIPDRINSFSDPVRLIPSFSNRRVVVALPMTIVDAKPLRISVPDRFRLAAATTTFLVHLSLHLPTGVKSQAPLLHLFQTKSTPLLP